MKKYYFLLGVCVGIMIFMLCSCEQEEHPLKYKTFERHESIEYNNTISNTHYENIYGVSNLTEIETKIDSIFTYTSTLDSLIVTIDTISIDSIVYDTTFIYKNIRHITLNTDVLTTKHNIQYNDDESNYYIVQNTSFFTEIFDYVVVGEKLELIENKNPEYYVNTEITTNWIEK
jgi:hypothetical protein